MSDENVTADPVQNKEQDSTQSDPVDEQMANDENEENEQNE